MSDLRKKLAGKFIVIDGPDGAGKSTQLKLLAEHLRAQGIPVVETHDPGGTPIGEKIRQVLLDNSHAEMTVGCETMLYMASRTQLMGQVISPAIKDNKCVLCDRWVSSTIAYQGAGGISPKTILTTYNLALQGAWPDLTIILDLPADVGLARAGRHKGLDRMEAKGAEFHEKVRELFLAVAAQRAGFVVVDAAGSVAEVQDRLREAVVKWRPERNG